MSIQLEEGDEVTIGDVIGLRADGALLIHHGAPWEYLALWRAGKRTGTGSTEAVPMELVRQGKKPPTPPTPHFMGCGCDGYRERK